MNVSTTVPGIYNVTSEFEPGTFYLVTASHNRGFVCDCPDFTYRGRDCKHIHAVGRFRADANDYPFIDEQPEPLPPVRTLDEPSTPNFRLRTLALVWRYYGGDYARAADDLERLILASTDEI